MFKPYLFLKKYVKEQEANKTEKRKQHHASLITETQKFNKWIANKSDKSGTCSIIPEPMVANKIVGDTLIVSQGIGGVKQCVQIVNDSESQMVKKQSSH